MATIFFIVCFYYLLVKYHSTSQIENVYVEMKDNEKSNQKIVHSKNKIKRLKFANLYYIIFIIFENNEQADIKFLYFVRVR